MAKLYIFGIGGTGSRVLRSLTMLLASGVNIKDEIIPIIIDPDQSNGDLTRTVSLMNDYSQIREKLSFPVGNKNTFFKTEISKLLNNYTLVVDGTNDKEFREFIDVSSMSIENQAITKMLFSDDNLFSSMDVGFKGNPNIGSVVLNQIANTNDFEKFANSFEANDKIFIISSIFGGTGASGFPLLLKTLRRGSNYSNNTAINNALIGAITILPYFRLETNEESSIDSSTFISKTKSALAYYEKNISANGQINALYFLGDDVTNIYENVEGGANQGNAAHLLELLAATAIVDFCNSNLQVGTSCCKELAIKSTGDTVSFGDFFQDLTNMIRRPLTQMMLFANCFSNNNFNDMKSEQVAGNVSLGLNADFFRDTFVSNLRDYFNKYKEWLGELKGNKRSLDLFDLSKDNYPFNIVTGVKPRHVASLSSNYGLVKSRIGSAARKCTTSSKEDKLMEAYSIATARLAKEKFNF